MPPSIPDSHLQQNPTRDECGGHRFRSRQSWRQRQGAFLPNGTRIPTDASTGTAEIENQNGDNVFVYAPLNNTKGAAHFDDVVMWQTQDELYSALGHVSCRIP